MKAVISAACFAAVAMISGTANAAGNGTEMVTFHDVKFGGKPPFRRSVETLPVSEVARFEAAPEVRVSEVNFNGRPPFKRSGEHLRVIDVARFEVDDTITGGNKRRLRFKSHAR